MGTSQKPVLGKAVSPSIAAEPQCLRPILGLSEEHKSKKKKQKKTINKRIKRKQKMKNKIATHVDLQEALWALWPRNNCDRTKCSTPLS